MGYPRSYTTKQVQDEKAIMELIDNYCEQNPEALNDPRDCFLAIREKLLQENLYSDDNAILAKSYFAGKAANYSPQLEVHEEYERAR